MKMNDDDRPPAYNEIIPKREAKRSSPSPFEAGDLQHELYPLVGPQFPTAPNLSHEGIPTTLTRIWSELPHTFCIQTGPKSPTLDNEEFYLRDAMDSLLVKGAVKKPEGQNQGFNHITMENVDGEIFLQILCVSGNCEVFHRNFSLGCLRVKLDSPESVAIYSSYEDPIYTVKFLSPKDIVISRANVQGHICKIHVPGQDRFDGTIVFSENRQITPIEQCLCVSVAFVFMAVRNDIGTEKATEDNEKSQCSLAIMCFLFIIGMIIFIAVIMNAAAEQKKRRGKYG